MNSTQVVANQLRMTTKLAYFFFGFGAVNIAAYKHYRTYKERQEKQLLNVGRINERSM